MYRLIYFVFVVLGFSCKHFRSGTNVECPKGYKNFLQMEFTKIDSGSFMMGGIMKPDEVVKKFSGEQSWFENEFPRHKVTISQSFLVSKYETTVHNFKAFIESTEYLTEAGQGKSASIWKNKKRVMVKDATWKVHSHKQEDNYPVVCVSWNDAMEFVKWLNKADASLPEGYLYNLPTEAQWEYFCRAGTETEYPWGNDEKDGIGTGNYADSSAAEYFNWPLHFNWNDGYIYSSPVGSFRPNNWGLYDVAGNVYEWTLDSGHDNKLFYWNSPVIDPVNLYEGFEKKMLRGGSWHSNQRGTRCSKRKGYSASEIGDNIGFRLVIVSSHE